MGAFFLYKNSRIQLDGVSALFKRKGFSSPRFFQLGNWKLNLYAKQLVGTPNFIQLSDSTGLFSCGSPVYKGKSYTASLDALLTDYISSGVEYDALLGNYLFIFWSNGSIRLLTDPLNVQHLFYDDGFSCLSTSFLAMLCASKEPLAVNRMAFYEKVAKGYILGPDTLVDGVWQWAPPLSQQPNDETLEIITPEPNLFNIDKTKNEINACIEHQVDSLKKYMAGINSLCSDYGAELGLSSGYDSRLLYALSKVLTTPLALHTHWTEGVHDKEKDVVARMASIRNAHLRVVNTNK